MRQDVRDKCQMYQDVRDPFPQDHESLTRKHRLDHCHRRSWVMVLRVVFRGFVRGLSGSVSKAINERLGGGGRGKFFHESDVSEFVAWTVLLLRRATDPRFGKRVRFVGIRQVE